MKFAEPITDQSFASRSRRARQAAELHNMGMEIKRQQFRREHPDWDESQVDAAMEQWMLSKPFFAGWPRSTRFD